MIINIWTTPRVGAIWYSRFLSQKHNALWLSEFFNIHNVTLYDYLDHNQRHLTTNNYFDGCFHREYSLVDSKITMRLDKSIRQRNPDDEIQYRLDLLTKAMKYQSIILHNQVKPMDSLLVKKLTEIADKNIYLYRKNKRAQLASYAIALGSNEWVKWKNYDINNLPVITDVNKHSLLSLIDKIKFWDSLDKGNSQLLAYEDIDFFDNEGLPLKQNFDYSLRLSDEIIKLINNIVTEYESNLIS